MINFEFQFTDPNCRVSTRTTETKWRRVWAQRQSRNSILTWPSWQGELFDPACDIVGYNFVFLCVCFAFLDTARWADQPCLWYGCVFWRPSLWTGLYTMYFAFNLQNSQMISKFAGRSRGRKRVQRTGMMVGTWEASARLWLWYKFNLRSIVFDGNTQLFQNVF